MKRQRDPLLDSLTNPDCEPGPGTLPIAFSYALSEESAGSVSLNR